MSRDFLRLPETPGERRQFKAVVDSIVLADRIRERRIKKNAELFQKKYGIKYCPFHRLSLIGDVEPDAETIRFYGGIDYKFTHIKCATWKLCRSNISFDEGLIERIKNEEHLIEVGLQGNPRCMACGEDKGRIYFTGFHIPISVIGDRGGEAVRLNPGSTFSGKSRLYLFERPCHTYLVANFNAPRLEPKNSQNNLIK